MNQVKVASSLRIVIVHPCEIIRLAIGSLLQQYGYTITHLFDTCESLDSQLGNIKADLVLVHSSQCLLSGLIRNITRTTGARVAMLASSDSFYEDSYQDILERIAEGVTGFLDIYESIYIFLLQLEEIASGSTVISKSFVQDFGKKASSSEDGIETVLSKRELAVLDLVATGCTNREIGQKLFISEHTAKSHLSQILSKLDLKNRQQAVAYIVKKRLANQ